MEIKPWLRKFVAAGVTAGAIVGATEMDDRQVQRQGELNSELVNNHIQNKLEALGIMSEDLSLALLELQQIVQTKYKTPVSLELSLDGLPDDFTESVEVGLVLTIKIKDDTSSKERSLFEQRTSMRISSFDSIQKHYIAEEARRLALGVVESMMKK